MITDINSEDRLVQKTFAEHLQNVLGWESVFAWNEETFGSDGTLGRADTREVVLMRELCAAPDERGDCCVNARLPGRESDGKMAA